MTQALNLSTGNFRAGTSVPGAYSGARKASALLAQLMRLHPDGNPFADEPLELSTPRSLMLDFRKNTFLKTDIAAGETLSYPAFGAMAEITRTGRAWSPNWSMRSGDPVGPLVEYANDDELRWNEPPDVGGGPLIETSGSSNLFRNPRGDGALPGDVAGAGALPDHWSAAANGATISVVSTGVENGWHYVEIRLSGTPAGAPYITLEQYDQLSVSTGDTRYHSIGVKIVDGDMSNLNNVQLVQRSLSGAGSWLTEGSTIFTPDDQHRRFGGSVTHNNGAVVYAEPTLYFGWDGSGAIDITIRVYCPQFETSLMSSPILPEVGTPAVSTRGAETRSGGLDFQRSSWGTHLDWDGTHGGVVKGLVEFMPDAPCHVPGKSLQANKGVTNENRNPRCEGATGTTAPTHWRNTSSGMTPTFEEVEIDGCPGVRVSGTSTGAGDEVSLYQEAKTQTSAAQNETWTASIGILKESSPALDSVRLLQYEYNSGGSSEASGGTDDFGSTLDNYHRRFKHTRTLSEAATAYVASRLRIIFDAAGDFSFILFVPQQEAGPNATNPVLPTPGTPAVSTRAKDEAVLDVSGWPADNGEPFAMCASGRIRGLNTSDRVRLVSIDDDSSSDRVNLSVLATGVPDAFAASGGATATNVSASDAVKVVGDAVKFAIRVNTDDYAVSYTGAAQDADTSGDIPVGLTHLRLGDWHSSDGQEWGGDIYSIGYAPGTWTDAELEAFAGN